MVHDFWSILSVSVCQGSLLVIVMTAKNAKVKAAFELKSSHVFEKHINLFSAWDRLEKIYVLFSWVEYMYLKRLLSNKLHYSFFTHSQFFLQIKNCFLLASL